MRTGKNVGKVLYMILATSDPNRWQTHVVSCEGYNCLAVDIVAAAAVGVGDNRGAEMADNGRREGRREEVGLSFSRSEGEREKRVFPLPPISYVSLSFYRSRQTLIRSRRGE